MQFIDEWYVEQVLGEGAFGEVKLLVNRKTKDEVALKIINLQQHSDAADSVRKEVQIHKLLDHENIIRFYGSRKEGPMEYLFLEYASGGELFDRIEPDFGMESSKAHWFFHQLINGVDYLHTLGIAHRDLKPENILLDAADKVKISDFGFATPFRIRGTERLLEKRCGTLPYVAPEVLKSTYKATPADIWSTGIILVALLAGELPWDKPAVDCQEFLKWKEGNTCGQPWNKLDIKALSFVKRLLCPAPSKRITMEQIQNHPWMISKSTNSSSTKEGNPLAKKMASGHRPSLREDNSITKLCLSQPEPRAVADRLDGEPTDCIAAADQVDGPRYLNNFSFSQPAAVDDIFLGSQLGAGSSNCSQSPPIHRWVKRMTRFCVVTPIDDTMKQLTKVLEEDLGVTMKVQNTSNITCVTISTVDKRRNILVFKAHVIEMGNNLVLLDFRLSRGDGLEFKRRFCQIRQSLDKIEWKGPMSWMV